MRTYRTSTFAIQSNSKIHLVDKRQLFTQINLQKRKTYYLGTKDFKGDMSLQDNWGN